QPPLLTIGAGSIFTSSVDFDSDGDLDVLVSILQSSPLLSRTFVLRNNGVGRFDVGPVLLEEASIFLARPADIDSDGRIDLLQLVIDPAGADTLRIHFQDAAGAFSPGPVFDAGVDNSGLAVADIDWDGRNDLVFVDRVGDNLPGNLHLFFQ